MFGLNVKKFGIRFAIAVCIMVMAIMFTSVDSHAAPSGNGAVAEVTVNGVTTVYDDPNRLILETSMLILQEYHIKLLNNIVTEGMLVIPPSSKATLDLNGCSINRNKLEPDFDTYSEGGVIYVSQSARLNIIDSDPEFEHRGRIAGDEGDNFKCWFEDGSSSAIIKGGVITGGANDTGGGGITIKDNATVVMKGGTIAGNVSFVDGGGVQLSNDGARFVLDGGDIKYNGAWRSHGGGICNKANGLLEIISGDISYNWTHEAYTAGLGGDGGGIYNNSETDRAVFIHGKDTSTGGQEKRNINISYNFAENGGGGIYQDEGEITIVNAAIEHNRCEDEDGGGILINDDGTSGSLTAITGCYINGNAAMDGDGGGIAVTDENYIQIANCVITNNQAAGEGGGVYFNAYRNGCCMRGCTVTGNRASRNGGGIYLFDVVAIGGTMIVKDNSANDGKNNLYLDYAGTSPDELTLDDLSPESEMYFHSDFENGDIVTKKGSKSSAKGIYGEGVGDNEYYFEKITDPSDEHYRHIRQVAGPAEPIVLNPVEVWNDVNKEAKKDSNNLGHTMKVESSKGTVNGAPVYRGYFRFADALNTGEDANYTANYYYSDGLFFNDPDTYDKHLAALTTSLTMASGASSQGITTVTNPNTQKNRFNYLTQVFSDIGCANESMYVNDCYMKKPESNTMGVAMANKVIYKNNEESEENAYLLIPVFVRSYNYGKEWMSNFTLGDGSENNGEAKGFSTSADRVMQDLDKYIKTHPEVSSAIESGKAIFWLGGYSRGGAVANLVSKRVTDKYAGGDAGTGKNNKVFSYCMAAAQGGVENLDKEGGYKNIHNIINKSDFVTYVAPNEMGFKRYGVDHYMPGGDAGSVSSETRHYGPDDDPLTIYSDNSFYEVDYNSQPYLELRRKFIKQLGATLYRVDFDDYFKPGEINYLWGNDYTSWIPFLGRDMITEADYPPLATKEKFNRQLWARLLSYSVNSANAGHDFIPGRNDSRDYREFYANNKTGHFMPGSSYNKNGSATLEETLTTLLEIAMGGEKELDLSNMPDISGSLTDVALDAYDELIGDLYKDPTPEGYTEWLDKIWGLLTKELTDEQKAKGYKNVKDILGDDVDKAQSVYPTLLAMVLDLVNDDYNDTNQGQYLLGTLAYNMDNMINEHLVNIAWIRADDDWYANDGETIYKMHIDADKPAAPAAMLSPVTEGGEEKAAVEGEDKNNKAKDTQVLYLRAQPGAAIYYTLYVDGTETITDELYQGVTGIELSGVENIKVKTYCKAYEQKSTEAVYNIEVITDKHDVTIKNPDPEGEDKEYTYREGDVVSVIADDLDDQSFTSWTVKDDQGRDVTDQIFAGDYAGNRTKPTAEFKMPVPDDDNGLSIGYTLTFTAVYDNKITDITAELDAPEYDTVSSAGKALDTDAKVTFNTITGKEFTYPVTWTYKIDDRDYIASGNALPGTKYTAKIAIPQGEAVPEEATEAELIAFAKRVEASLPSGSAETVEVSRDPEDGSVLIKVVFPRTDGETPEPSAKYKQLTVRAYDLNMQRYLGNENNAEYYVEEGTTVTLTAQAVKDELFAQWGMLKSGITVETDPMEKTVKLKIPSGASDDMTIRAEYIPIVNKVDIELPVPEGGKELAGKVSSMTVKISNDYIVDPECTSVTWTPAPKKEGEKEIADFEVAYTATVKLKPYPEGHEHAGKIKVTPKAGGGPLYVDARFYYADVVDARMNGEAVALNKKDSSLNQTFPATTYELADDAKDPDDVTGIPYGANEAKVREQLPETIELLRNDGRMVNAPVSWNLTKEDPDDPRGKTVWTAKGTVTLPDNMINPVDDDHPEGKYDLDVTMNLTTDEAAYAASPESSLRPGSYMMDEETELSTRTEDAEIWYTTDGTDPLTSDTVKKYDGTPVKIAFDPENGKLSVTLKAYTKKNGLWESKVATYVYEFLGEVMIPGGNEATYNGEPKTGVEGSRFYTLEAEEGSGVTIDEDGNAVATKAGTYTVTAKIKKGYKWKPVKGELTTEDQTITFTIAPADISDAAKLTAEGTFKSLDDLKKALKVEPTGDVELKEDEDYEIIYGKVENGKVTVALKGKGNYSGTVSATFIIEEDKPEKKKYTVTYDLNGGELDGKTGVISEEYYDGTAIKLPKPERDGYTFDYWRGSKYSAGQTYVVNEDHTFTAQWKKDSADPSDPDDKDGKDGNGNGSGKDGNGSGKNGNKGGKGIGGVKTGDGSNALIWIFLLSVSVLILALAARRRRKN